MSDKEVSLTIQDQRVGFSLVNDFMKLDLEQQEKLLTEYDKRRQGFIDWLLEKMEEGVHYGHPPGVPQGKTNPKQWKQKKSLYKAGAQFISDVLRIQPVYDADYETWEMIGKPAGAICVRCTLVASSEEKSVIGYGHGVYEVGDKRANANAARKKAQKCAWVDAVLTNVPGMSDLFTQDIEDLAKKREERQAEKAATQNDKPKEKPKESQEKRAQRVIKAFSKLTITKDDLEAKLETPAKYWGDAEFKVLTDINNEYKKAKDKIAFLRETFELPASAFEE